METVSNGESLILAVLLMGISILVGVRLADHVSRTIENVPEPDEPKEDWFLIADATEAARKIQAGADLCWRQARNGDNGERLCQAYQVAAGHIEAAVSLIKKAGA